MPQKRKKIIAGVKRIVLKIGSAVLASPEGGLDEEIIKEIAASVGRLKKKGYEVVIVSSGSILAGTKRLGLKKRPQDIPKRQAAAAIGQSHLIWLYQKHFDQHQTKVAQILLTHDDLSNRRRYINAKNTLETLLGYGVVPIINENDSVVVEEIKLGDNDNLSAMVTGLVQADILVILSDIDGIYNRNPRKNSDARLFEEIDPFTPEIQEIKTASPFSAAFSNGFGTGGIKTKIEAVEKVVSFGAAAIIANGRTPGILDSIFSGEKVGTLVLPRQNRLTSRKHWIAHVLKPKGKLYLDDGARQALVRGGSLLPIGIIEVEGSFESGDCIRCLGSDGEEFARGLVNYNTEEIQRILGKQTNQIEEILGYKVYDEVIHRNNLAFTS